MRKTIDSKVTLNNGVEMPYFGLGVFQTDPGAETQNAVRYAIEAGYRHVDTAKIYENEQDVGIAVKNSDLSREDIFITTKVWNSDQGYDRTVRACNESLRRLDLDYVDLYLIHWPVKGRRAETWRAMITLLEEGKCRAIGVSNYTIRHLEEMLAGSHVVPAVNQVEFSPFLYQRELLAFCRAHKIQLEAYGPLTRGRRFKEKTLVSIATRYGRTPAQILIRWALEHDLVVIPKSVRRERIHENADVFDFELTSEDMASLDSLDEGFRTTWDPSDVP
jgi:diketogulonate reductase-like aldo/keto reductase